MFSFGADASSTSTTGVAAAAASSLDEEEEDEDEDEDEDEEEAAARGDDDDDEEDDALETMVPLRAGSRLMRRGWAVSPANHWSEVKAAAGARASGKRSASKEKSRRV